MPSTDASDLTKTLVGLAREHSGTPTGGNAFKPFTLGNGNGVDQFVLSKNTRNRDDFFKMRVGPINLVSNCAAIDLDFHNMGSLLTNVNFADLGMRNNANDICIALDAFEGIGNWSTAVSSIFLDIFGEGLVFGVIPVPIESAAHFLSKMFGPNSSNGFEALWGAHVANKTNDDHWGRFKDSDCLDDFPLVHLGSNLVKVTDYMGHSSFVSHEGCEVNRLGGIIFWE